MSQTGPVRQTPSSPANAVLPSASPADASADAGGASGAGSTDAAMEAPRSFEAAMDELERILQELERGDVSLEQSLARYRRGVFLIQQCRRVLTEAERQVELLTRGPDGSVQTRPLDGP